MLPSIVDILRHHPYDIIVGDAVFFVDAVISEDDIVVLPNFDHSM